jgi:SAM-dependent methyltransferase
MQNTNDYLPSVRQVQKQIEHFTFKKLIGNVFDFNLLQTRHFREWLKVPMNYCRIMELPLTLKLLDLGKDKKERILDISSPKLLALFLAINGYNIVASDLEDYFISDFEVVAKKCSVPLETNCFDATNIPYENESFDKIFSISVFEHIPDNGDIEAVKEVARILKPNGSFVMTLPAYKTYLEEWIKDESFYWRSKHREDGSVFFQRRYTENTIRERFEGLGLDIEEIIWIAEKPIKQPELNKSGRLDHNVYYIEGIPMVKLLKQLTAKLPLISYFLYNYYSYKTHYLTYSFDDDNIRQVAVKFTKL